MSEGNFLSNSQEPQPAARRRGPCLRWGCIVFGVVVVLAAVAVLVVRQKIRSSLTDEQWVQIQAMETEVVTLPEEWHRPATLPPLEIVAFWDDFSIQMESILDKHQALMGTGYDPASTSTSLFEQMRSNAVPVRPDQQTSYSLLLADLQPLFDETSRTASLPGYTVETDLYTTQIPKFLYVQTFAMLASVVGRQHAAAGDCIGAVETAALPIRLIKHGEYDSALIHLYSVAVTGISVNALNSIATSCTDTLALERGLHLLNNLRDTTFPGHNDLWRYADSLGALRYAAAHGYPVDLSPQTQAGYYSQARWLYTPRYWQWIVDNLPATDRRVEVAKARIAQHMEWQENDWYQEIKQSQSDYTNPYPIAQKAAALVLGVDPYALLAVTAASTFKETETRTKTAMALYDLTRLRFAQRLAELKGLPVPTAYDDPFTSGPLPFSSAKKSFYSVGPDTKDDRSELLYDATNGTISPGDLIVE